MNDEETKRVRTEIQNKIFRIIYIVFGIVIFFNFESQKGLFKNIMELSISLI
jgi:hypothetical protein